MLITKFDLYRAEWLDLVFSNRNKNYGAYELRQTYASTMLKSMGITVLGVGVALAVVSFVIKPAIQPPPILGPNDRLIEVTILPKVEPAKPITPEQPAAAPAAAKPATVAAVKTSVIPVHVVSDDKPTIEPPKIEGLTGAIGSTQIDGPVGGDNTAAGTGTDLTGTGIETGTGDGGGGTGNGVYDFNAIEVLPEPVGGKEAWSKFLQKNLRYPGAAEREGMNGRVFLSFIIEKDGRLTDIKVERGAGFGFDEEALRVLKMAPAWKPGIQNGRPVRVKYTIPINFRAPE